MAPFESGLIVAAVLIIASVAASKTASRLGIPSLLLFLAIGIAGGPHGLGHIVFPGDAAARDLGIFALIFILFSGGIDTKLSEIRPVLTPAIILSTLGVLITTACVGAFAHLVMGFRILEGGLLGATIASTDVAAVFTAMRSRNVSLKKGLAPLLELESALNDPVTVLLGVALLASVSAGGMSGGALARFFVQEIVVGAALGWASGKLQLQLINRIRLEFEGLYPVLSLGWVVLTYAIIQKLGGSGFLAVYLSGLIVGNENLLHKRSLVHFHEGVAWLGQIGMFLAMGLLVTPADILQVAPIGIALSVFLVFVARPAAVFGCLAWSRFDVREKAMISWGGLRGAVPIILATYVLAAHISRGAEIFNLVFVVTFLSVLMQGSALTRVASFLRVDRPQNHKFRFALELNPVRNVKSKLVEVPIPPESPAIGKSLLNLDLPKDVLVVLIHRGEDVIVPRGATQLQVDDVLLVLAESETVEEVERIFRNKTASE